MNELTDHWMHLCQVYDSPPASRSHRLVSILRIRARLQAETVNDSLHQGTAGYCELYTRADESVDWTAVSAIVQPGDTEHSPAHN